MLPRNFTLRGSHVRLNSFLLPRPSPGRGGTGLSRPTTSRTRVTVVSKTKRLSWFDFFCLPHLQPISTQRSTLSPAQCFFVTAFLSYNLEVPSVSGEEIACATVSPHLCILPPTKRQWYPPLRQLHSDFGHFNNRVSHVMKITASESNPDSELLTQQTLMFF